MKLKFEEFKLPNAKFFLLQDESELKLAIAKIGFPLIIKLYFSEMTHLVPSHRFKDNALNDLAHKACKVLGIDRGVAHVEIKIKDGNFYLIEVGARTEDGIMDQIENAFNFNLYHLHIASYLGANLEHYEVSEPKRTANIAFLKAKIGTIKKIHLPQKLPQELTSLKITARIGDKSVEAKDWSTREGVMELIWENHFFKEKTTSPIDLANALSEQIFELECCIFISYFQGFII